MRAPLNVLIVEDSADDRDLLVRELTRQGFSVEWEQVCTAPAMEDALERRKWDAVLADYRMPTFDAPGALRVLKASGRDLPFLVVSGNIGEDLAVAIMREGAHDYLMKGNLTRIGAAIERELREAKVRRERRLTLATLDHTNRVLQAIRRVNQLIVHETDPHRLIDQACECMVRTRGYIAAWIAECEEGGGIRRFASRGYGESEAPLRERIEKGRMPTCASAAMRSGKVTVVDEPREECADCTILEELGAHETLSVRLEHAGCQFGVMCVQLPAEIDCDAFEESLMAELAGDLGYALRSLEASAERDRLRATLAQRVRQATCMQKVSTLIAENTGATGDILPLVADLIPACCPDAESASVRIVLEHETVGTPRSPEVDHLFDTPIRIHGEDRGIIEVLDGKRRDDELPAPLPEESKSAIREIAQMLGAAVERERNAALLKRSESLLDAAEQLSGIGGWEWNVDRAEMFWSRQTYRIHELAPGSIPLFSPKHMLRSLRCYSPEDRPRIEGAFRRCLSDGTPYDLECRFKTLKGRNLWIRTAGRAERVDGRIVRVFGTILDVTEQKRADEALRRSEESFRLFFERVPQYCYLTSPTGTILDVNRTALEALGYEKRELVGRSVADLYAPGSRARSRALLETWAATGRLKGEELVVRTKSGEERTVLLDAVALRESHSAPWNSILMQRDVTASRHLEAQLRQSQKLEAIGQLAGGVAHDFNNLLTVILGQCELASRAIRPEDPLGGKLEQVRTAAERAVNLTRQLLAFSRKQTLMPRPLDLNEVVRDLEGMLGRLLGENIEFEFLAAPDLGRTFADEGQIGQIVMNLAVNARDAMPSGGRLTIRTANVEWDRDAPQARPDVDPGSYVRLTVTDTGSGFDEETAVRLFEPFFTTKGQGKGTGLGLSTVYGIVKQSLGTISVESRPGEGTTFDVYLPRTDEAPEASMETAGEEGLNGSGETILVVEDEPSIRELVVLMLQEFGYRTILAADGGEALVVVEEKGVVPDLILTDVIMPGINGAVLASRLRRSLPDLKVLFMSGYSDDAIAHHGVLDPGVPFLSKPFTALELGAAVREVLSGGRVSGREDR